MSDQFSHRSEHACEKCSAMAVDVYEDDRGDFLVVCTACGNRYRVDGPDA